MMGPSPERLSPFELLPLEPPPLPLPFPPLPVTVTDAEPLPEAPTGFVTVTPAEYCPEESMLQVQLEMLPGEGQFWGRMFQLYVNGPAPPWTVAVTVNWEPSDTVCG